MTKNTAKIIGIALVKDDLATFVVALDDGTIQYGRFYVTMAGYVAAASVTAKPAIENIKQRLVSVGFIPLRKV